MPASDELPAGWPGICTLPYDADLKKAGRIDASVQHNSNNSVTAVFSRKSPPVFLSLAELQAQEPRLYGRMRFEGSLEAQFRSEPDTARRRARHHLIITLLLVVLAAPIYGREIVNSTGTLQYALRWLEFGLLVPGLLISWLWLRRTEDPTEEAHALMLGAVVGTCGLMALSFLARLHGANLPAIIASVYITAVFLIGRPPLRLWLPVSAVLMVLYVVAQILLLVSDSAARFDLMLQILLYIISALAAYYLEFSIRVAWLKMRMLEAVARTDPLTGVLNRRGFDECFEGLYHAAEVDQRPMALILIDLDHFKPLNDHYGHDYGDACLQAVGQMLRQFATKSGDLAARFGGEEFVLCLSERDAEATQCDCQALLDDLKLLNIENKGSAIADTVTASLGAVCFIPDPGVRWPDVIRQADGLLYEAKHGGRNRYVFKDLSLNGD